ncbi:hypothetical protein BO86DRAFT_398431 [Aspergillus japonicus CBS 114.51]|uniref:Uncharacterized protein n=1 Tax=Aspergillus japonicus CBS 114.51 TaxID=1448312 RepID=A0A8T8X4L9_ASPJA|nr:hypothetical protein BO86DRAFT_398431 [Aspergillus japonicus CBS 114.51]RAH83063.1 hypothetical protein BO86DRAFT_398431 [Aspergillus japonicus CBS 114.51]
MDYLFYDIFKDGKTLADATRWQLKDESDFAWASFGQRRSTRSSWQCYDCFEERPIPPQNTPEGQ